MKVRAFKIKYLLILLLSFALGNVWASNIDSLVALFPSTNDTNKVLLNIQIGKAYAKIRDYKSALPYYTNGAELSKKINYRFGEASAAQYIGKLYSRKSSYDTAEVFYNNAILIYEKINRPDSRVDCLNDLAVLFYYRGEYSSAIKICFDALKYANKVTDQKIIGRINNNLGNCYYFQKNFEKALFHYNNAYEIELKYKNKTSISNCLGNIGLINYEMGDYELALKNHLKSYDLQCEMRDTNEMAASLLNIGVVYEKMNQPQKALPMFEKSYALRLAIKDNRRLAFSMIKVALINSKLGNYVEAQKLYKDAIDIATKNESLQYLMEAYGGLSELYEKTGNYKQALSFHQEYTHIKDSIYNQINAQEIAEAQEKYESTKKQKQLELLKKDQIINQIKLEKNKSYLITTIIIIISIVILMGLLFKQYRSKKESNLLLEEQNLLITVQKKEITDSINYASIIQRAMLPLESEFNTIFENNFIYYLPKDIVSGDFYWCSQRDNKKILVVADCTGHGVPGAMMSMIGNNLLNQAINDQKLGTPEEILDFLDKGIGKSLHQNHSQDTTKNSIDLAICIIDSANQKLVYGGSVNPVYLLSQGELNILKTDKSPIGYDTITVDKKFNSYEVNYKKGDRIYLMTDGIQDQFGGENGKKLMTKTLKEFIIKIQPEKMSSQHSKIKDFITSWQGNYDQTDDMLLVAIEL